jgi:sensor histidine kinase regulating citrate/malate metabolism
LGLQNLHQLTENLHGKIKLESELQSGTKIEIMLPNRMLKGEAIV